MNKVRCMWTSWLHHLKQQNVFPRFPLGGPIHGRLVIGVLA